MFAVLAEELIVGLSEALGVPDSLKLALDGEFVLVALAEGELIVKL